MEVKRDYFENGETRAICVEYDVDKYDEQTGRVVKESESIHFRKRAQGCRFRLWDNEMGFYEYPNSPTFYEAIPAVSRLCRMACEHKNQREELAEKELRHYL